MSFEDVVRLVLVALGVAFLLTSVVGALAPGTAYDRLHFSSPGAIFGPLLICLAVVVDFGFFSQAGLKTMLTTVLVITLNPVLVHATARAARIREHGQLDYEPEPTA